jgi:hypothetical protein
MEMVSLEGRRPLSGRRRPVPVPEVTSQVCNHLINTGRQVKTSSPYCSARDNSIISTGTQNKVVPRCSLDFCTHISHDIYIT